jgi:hypothetical protein
MFGQRVTPNQLAAAPASSTSGSNAPEPLLFSMIQHTNREEELLLQLLLARCRRQNFQGFPQQVEPFPNFKLQYQGSKSSEALMFVYHPRVVSYSELVKVFMDRLAATISQYKIKLFQDEKIPKPLKQKKE